MTNREDSASEPPLRIAVTSSFNCAGSAAAVASVTKSASASIGRAMDTMSAHPVDRTSSATSGVLMRLDVMIGMPTLPISFFVTQAKAARGTEVAMVGIRASCQPIPVFRIVAPAFSISTASCTTSSWVEPLGTRSIIDSR